MPIRRAHRPSFKWKGPEDRARLETLKRLTKEAFAALDRGEHATFTPESLDAFFDQIDRSTGRR